MNISEGSKVSMPIRSLISFIGFTCVAAFTLTQIYGRLGNIEIKVSKNSEWVQNFKPPADVQDAVKRVRELELQMATLKSCKK